MYAFIRENVAIMNVGKTSVFEISLTRNALKKCQEHILGMRSNQNIDSFNIFSRVFLFEGYLGYEKGWKWPTGVFCTLLMFY